MRVLADASEHIEHFAPGRLRILNAVRRQDRQSIGARKIDKLTVDLLFAANEMPLNFNENIFATKCIDEKSRSILRILGSAGAFACTVRCLAERREISGEGAG